MVRVCLILCLALVASASAAVPAARAVTFSGTTNQGRAAAIRVDEGGVVRRVTIGWRGACRDGKARLKTSTRFTGPFDGATPDAADGRGRYRGSDPGGERLRYRVRFTAKRTSTYRWKGTFSGAAEVRYKGKVIDRCRSGKLRWTATIPQLTVDMTGEPGDYITQGMAYALRTPQDALSLRGSKQTVQVEAAGYEIAIDAPKGKRLNPGTFAAIRYPFNTSEGKGGLDVSGNGRGCNEVSGTVTVESSAFDRKGRVKRIAFSFEHHCEGGPIALRGHVTYER